MQEGTSEYGSSKEYLEKSFLEELNYKIWSTRSSRFNADKRLRTRSKLSNISLAILSAYLIIAGLMSVYNVNIGNDVNLINYAITGLSILLLVFSQYENAQDYKLNAKIYHDCGLELSVLYNELRIFKTIKKNPADSEIYEFGKSLSERYQLVLKNYDNHATIDYDLFQISNIGYFKKVSPEKVTPLNILKVKLKYYWMVYGWYSIMIIMPPILFVLLFVRLL